MEKIMDEKTMKAFTIEWLRAYKKLQDRLLEVEAFRNKLMEKVGELELKNDGLLYVLKQAAPWMGKLIADEVHLKCVNPQHAINTLELIENAINRIEPEPEKTSHVPTDEHLITSDECDVDGHYWIENEGLGGPPKFVDKIEGLKQPIMYVRCQVCGDRSYFTQTKWTKEWGIF